MYVCMYVCMYVRIHIEEIGSQFWLCKVFILVGNSCGSRLNRV